MTSKGFDDAKLGVPVEEWPTFLELANEAATLWPSQLLRTCLLHALTEQKAEICLGVVEEGDSSQDESVRKVRKIQVAGFGHFEATAALEKCGGDASKALELLTTGWSPGLHGSTTELGVIAIGGDSPQRCPFSGSLDGSFGEAPSGYPQRCPFAAPVREKTAPVAPPGMDDRTAEAVRTLAERGIPASQIAVLLQVDEAAVNSVTSAGAGSRMGRILGNNLQEKLDDLLTEDSDLCCPVSLVLLSDPVIASDGFLYEKASLEEILRQNAISPMTREGLKEQFFSAVERKKKALEFRETRSKELLSFADEAIVAGQQQMAVVAAERIADYLKALAPGSCTSIKTKLKDTYSKLNRPYPVF